MGSFTFTGRQRLRNKAEFEHVYQRGQRCSQSLFQTNYCGNAVGFARLGLSIAARTVGNAVSRNRIRRAVRESFRQLQHELPAVDFIISARPRAREASSAELRADLGRLLMMVRDRCARSSSPSSPPTAG